MDIKEIKGIQVEVEEQQSEKLELEIEEYGNYIGKIKEFIGKLRGVALEDMRMHVIVTSDTLGSIEKRITKQLDKDKDKADEIESYSYMHIGKYTKEKTINNKKEKAKVIVAERKPMVFEVYIPFDLLDTVSTDCLADAVIAGFSDLIFRESRELIESKLDNAEMINDKYNKQSLNLIARIIEHYFINYAHCGKIDKFIGDELDYVIADINMLTLGIVTKKWKMIGKNVDYTLSVIGATAVANLELGGEELEKYSKVKIDINSGIEVINKIIAEVNSGSIQEMLESEDNNLLAEYIKNIAVILEELNDLQIKKGKKKKK